MRRVYLPDLLTTARGRRVAESAVYLWRFHRSMSRTVPLPQEFVSFKLEGIPLGKICRSIDEQQR